MNAHRGRPLTSLTAILVLWVAVRAWEWSKWADESRSAQAREAADNPQKLTPQSPKPVHREMAMTIRPRREKAPPPLAFIQAPAQTAIGMKSAPRLQSLSFPRITFSLSSSHATLALPPPKQINPALSEPHHDRWSLSAWSILRRTGSLNPAIPSGQLGGSQIGLRLVHHVQVRPSGMGLNAYVRASTPVSGRSGQEAALGLSAKFRKPLTLEIGVERRLSLAKGGNGGWTFITSGGVNNVKLAGRIHLDGYAQAGIVGRHRHDGFADGEMLTSYHLAVSGKTRIEPGLGLWGAVQPGLQRLDVGPALTIRPMIAGTRYRISAQWRARIKGNARPGSGPALVVGADF